MIKSYNCAVCILLAVLFTSLNPLKAQYSGGDGSIGNPFQIATFNDLVLLSETQAHWSNNFIQTADIDAVQSVLSNNGAGFRPIGNNTVLFTGTYNGNEKEISNLFINRPSTDNIALFGRTGPGSSISGLGLVDVNFTGRNFVGGLVGRSNSAEISNAFVFGGVINGVNNVGGLLGLNSSAVTNSYAVVSVSASSGVGGLIGVHNLATIQNTYAAGSVTGSSSLGGLIGSNISGTINTSFWNTQTSGQTVSAGGEGRTTVQFQNQNTFSGSGWNFPDIWRMGSICTNNQFPLLSWQTTIEERFEGLGTQASPYLISNKQQLKILSENTCLWSNSFLQVEDIFFTNADYELGGLFYNNGLGFSPIGNPSLNFIGNYNGGGKIINGLRINRPNTDNVGLFGVVSGNRIIQNLSLENGFVNGRINVGLLVGFFDAGGSILNCSTAGSVAGTEETLGGNSGVGGLVGQTGAVTVQNCFSNVQVAGRIAGGLVGFATGQSISNSGASGNVTGRFRAGGLVGETNGTVALNTCFAMGNVQMFPDLSGAPAIGGLIGRSTGSITNSFATGNVTSAPVSPTGITFNSWVGGLAGFAVSQINRCYATGNVQGRDAGGLLGSGQPINILNSYSLSNVSGTVTAGGLVASIAPGGPGQPNNTISNSYHSGNIIASASNTDVGGIFGRNTNTFNTQVTSSYWNSTISGITTGLFGAPRTTAQLQQQSTFVGWNFVSIWRIGSLCAGSSFPTLAWQITVESAFVGQGTEEEPFLISTLQDLIRLSVNPCIWDRNYLQTADIDASTTNQLNSGTGFSPIGSNNVAFTGKYNGADFSISNLHINRPSSSLQGLFGVVNNSNLKNIHLKSVTITGDNELGILAGRISGSVLENINVEGSITAQGSTVGGISASSFNSTLLSCKANVDLIGVDQVGGLIGSLQFGLVSNSEALGSINATGMEIGGLIGNIFLANVNRSYSNIEVEGNTTVGGLIGYSDDGTLTNCYAIGSVSGINNIGGLVGFNDFGALTNTYAAGEVSGTSNVGGLVGLASGGDVTASFWDVETSGLSLSAGGTGKLTEELQIQSTFTAVDWDFETIWVIDECDIGYPVLQWQSISTRPDAPLAEDQNFCGEPTVANLVAEGEDLRWYLSNFGGEPLEQNISLETRTYFVSQTVDDCESLRTAVLVVVTPTPIITVEPFQNICAGESITLTATGADSFIWSNGIENGVAFTPTGTGEIEFTVIGLTNGCESELLLVTITVNPLPVLTVEPIQPICLGESITLTASGAATYSWSGGIENGVAFMPTGSGIFTVTGTSELGCESESLTVSVTVNPIPVVTVEPIEPICAGQSLTLTASGADTFSWSGGIENGVAFTPSASGNFTVIGTSLGCTSEPVTVAVTVNPNPVVTVEPFQPICAGESITLSATGANSFVWTGGIENGIAFTPTQSANFTVIGSNEFGCTSEPLTVTVTVNPLPVVTVQPISAVCVDEEITLIASGADSYTWTGGVENGVAFIPDGTADFTVVGTSLGCESEPVTVTVTVNPNPVVTINTVEPICAGEEVTLTATGADSFAWSGGIENAVAFIPQGTSEFTVIGTSLGCQSEPVTVVVTVKELPTLEITAPQGICGAGEVTISALSTGDITFPMGIENSVAFTINETTSFSITAVLNNCEVTELVTIEVNTEPILQVSADFSVCENDEVVLVASGANQISWDNGVLNGVPFTITQTTTFSVTGVNAGCAPDNAEVTITVNPIPLVTVEPISAVCTGESVTLTATGADSFTWSGGVENGVAFVPDGTADFTVVGTSLGCESEEV
ncbi:MAG: GLUG motif-containing protein, partial [Luteibaculaceae bacterium]